MGELGRGGFGAVFLAHDPELGRDVALKILTKSQPRALARFEREMRACARLRHPGIVAVHDSGTFAERPYLVMEYVAGDTVQELVRQDRLTLSRAVELVREAALALDYAHGEGILHRDVKPANIIVDRDGHARLLDFGLARSRSDTDRLSRTGVPLGTPAYMAPEQFRGGKVDARADVYGLGGVLYFCLTGEAPREGLGDLFEGVGANRPPSARSVNPEVPPQLEGICRRCLEPLPENRFASAGEVAAALGDFLSASPSRGPRGPRAVLVAVAGSALLASTGLTALWSAADTSSSPAAPAPPTPGAQPPRPASSDERRLADARALLARADYLAANGDLRGVEEARALLARARDLFADSPTAREERTRLESKWAVLEALGRAEAAARRREAWETVDRFLDEARQGAAALGPRLRARVALARCHHLFRRGRYVACARACDDLLAADDDPARRNEARLLGALARCLGADPEAQAAGARALQNLIEDTSGEDPLGLLARACFASHGPDPDNEVALRYARRARSAAPDDPLALLQLGIALLNTQRSEEAYPLFRRLTDTLVPDMVRAHLGAALAGYQANRLTAQQALERLDLALELSRGGESPGSIHALRGHILLFAGQFAAAEQALETALALRHQKSAIHLLLGMTREMLGRWKAAEEAVRRAHELDPVETLGVLETVRPLALRHRFQRILGRPVQESGLAPGLHALRARLLEDVPPAARPPLGTALDAALRGAPYSGFREALTRAEETAPKAPRLALLAARLRLGRGQSEAALRSLAAARAAGAPPARVAYLEGLTAWRAGRFLEARRALAAAPAGPDGACARALEHCLRAEWAQGAAAASAAPAQGLVALDALCLRAWCLVQSGAAAEGLALAEEGLGRYGLLDPWLATIQARALLARAFARHPHAQQSEVNRGLLAVERACHATGEALPRTTGLDYLCLAEPGSVPHRLAGRWLFELERSVPDFPALPLYRSLFAIQRGASRESAQRAVRAARARGVPPPLPPALLEAYRARFGAELSLDALRDEGR